MLLHLITSEFLPQALKLKEELHISQFLRNLCPELEPVQATLMNREASPDLDTCVQEVLREEIWLVTRHSLITDPKALLTTPAPNPTPTPTDKIALLIARGQQPQCHECKRVMVISSS